MQRVKNSNNMKATRASCHPDQSCCKYRISPLHLPAIDDKATLQKLLDSIPPNSVPGDNQGRTALMYAILGNNIPNVKLLIKCGADVNAVDLRGNTALHLATLRNQPEIVKILLAKGCDWKVQNNEGATALHLAAKKKTPKCLSGILKCVASGEVDIQDYCKRTALHWAAACGFVDNVRLLVKCDSNIGIPDVEGKIPLHSAVECSHDSAVDVLTILLSKMISAVSWSDYEGKSPLHLAVISGKIATVTKLVSSDGCDINAIDNNFQTPLHCAASLGLTEIVKFLCAHGADAECGDHNRRTPLHYAARENFSDTIAALLTGSRQLVVKQDIDGNSALFWAVNHGAFDAVSTLCKFHADVNQVGQNGATVLHAAANMGNLQMVELLLQSEACVDPKDKRGMTPLMYACEMSDPKIVRRLMRAGADIMHLDGEGRSTLHWAAIGGQPDICVALVDCGLDVNVRDNLGRTPLHLATSKVKTDCVWALIQNGANCDEQDHEGMTALHWACKNGSLAIVVLLVNYSSNINAMRFTADRFTPLNLAVASQQNPEVIQHLIEQGALPIEHVRELAAQTIQVYFRNYLKKKKNLDRQRIMKTREDNDNTFASGSSVAEEKRKLTQDLRKDEPAKAKKRYKKRTQRRGNQAKKLAASDASLIENFHTFAISPELKTIKHKTKRFQSPSVELDSSFSTSKQLGASFESDDSGKKSAISKRIPGLFDKSRFKLNLKKGKKSAAKDEKPQDEEAESKESVRYDEQLLKMLEVQWHERLCSAQCTKMPFKM